MSTDNQQEVNRLALQLSWRLKFKGPPSSSMVFRRCWRSESPRHNFRPVCVQMEVTVPYSMSCKLLPRQMVNFLQWGAVSEQVFRIVVNSGSLGWPLVYVKTAKLFNCTPLTAVCFFMWKLDILVFVMYMYDCFHLDQQFCVL
jgi:hypothetical protein